MVCGSRSRSAAATALTPAIHGPVTSTTSRRWTAGASSSGPDRSPPARRLARPDRRASRRSPPVPQRLPGQRPAACDHSRSDPLAMSAPQARCRSLTGRDCSAATAPRAAGARRVAVPISGSESSGSSPAASARSSGGRHPCDHRVVVGQEPADPLARVRPIRRPAPPTPRRRPAPAGSAPRRRRSSCATGRRRRRSSGAAGPAPAPAFCPAGPRRPRARCRTGRGCPAGAAASSAGTGLSAARNPAKEPSREVGRAGVRRPASAAPPTSRRPGRRARPPRAGRSSAPWARPPGRASSAQRVRAAAIGPSPRRKGPGQVRFVQHRQHRASGGGDRVGVLGLDHLGDDVDDDVDVDRRRCRRRVPRRRRRRGPAPGPPCCTPRRGGRGRPRAAARRPARRSPSRAGRRGRRRIAPARRRKSGVLVPSCPARSIRSTTARFRNRMVAPASPDASHRLSVTS